MVYFNRIYWMFEISNRRSPLLSEAASDWLRKVIVSAHTSKRHYDSDSRHLVYASRTWLITRPSRPSCLDAAYPEPVLARMLSEDILPAPRGIGGESCHKIEPYFNAQPRKRARIGTHRHTNSHLLSIYYSSAVHPPTTSTYRIMTRTKSNETPAGISCYPTLQ
jgi:hypothetical protein